MINEFDQNTMKTMINASIKIDSDRLINMMKMQMNAQLKKENPNLY